MKKIIFILAFMLNTSCSTMSASCVDHGGFEYCTQKETSLNNSFGNELNKKDLLIAGNVSKKWNLTILKVHNYLKKNNINPIMLLDTTIRKPVRVAVRITDKGSYYKTELLQNEYKENILKSLDEGMKNASTFLIFEILLKAKLLAKTIEKKYVSGLRKIIETNEYKKNKVDPYGNLYIDNSIKSDLSNHELELVMLHEAFHLFPISFENNIILRKYININFRKNLKKYKSSIIRQSNNNKYFSISYSEIFNDDVLMDVFNRESRIDFNVINYMKRNNENCNEYVNLLKKIGVKGSRFIFSNTYCNSINKGANIQLIETYHDVFFSEIKHTITLDKAKYSTTDSVEKLISGYYMKNNFNVEKSLALKLISEIFFNNKKIIKDKNFSDFLNN